jgi:hypothetical protein
VNTNFQCSETHLELEPQSDAVSCPEIAPVRAEAWFQLGWRVSNPRLAATAGKESAANLRGWTHGQVILEFFMVSSHVSVSDNVHSESFHRSKRTSLADLKHETNGFCVLGISHLLWLPLLGGVDGSWIQRENWKFAWICQQENEGPLIFILLNLDNKFKAYGKVSCCVTLNLYCLVCSVCVNMGVLSLQLHHHHALGLCIPSPRREGGIQYLRIPLKEFKGLTLLCFEWWWSFQNSHWNLILLKWN